MYDSALVMKYLIAKINESGRGPCNITKLNKLLYICYGAYLVRSNDISNVDSDDFNRLTSEHPQIWPYGPVFPRAHKAADRIIKSNTLNNYRVKDEQFSEIYNDAVTNTIINAVIDTFGSWTASQLVNWTHRPEGAWQNTINTFGEDWSRQMNDGTIYEVFSDIVSK